MKLSPSKARSLEFEIGDHTYEVTPANIPDGLRLAEMWTRTPAELAKLKISNVELFTLAMGGVWEQMVSDGVPYSEAFRAGMACLAREQTLLVDDGPDRWDNAERAAAAVWESGIDPEHLAAYMAAARGEETPRKTPQGGAATTRRRASGTGTSATSGRKPKASRSGGATSARSGR